MKASVLTSNYYHTLKEWRRDSKSFNFESVFEFIVIASVYFPKDYHIIVRVSTFMEIAQFVSKLLNPF